MKIITKIGVLLPLILAMASCGKDDGLDTIPEPNQERPIEEAKEPVTLTSIAPLQGPKETIVTIKGRGFGTDPEAISVFVNDKEMPITSMDHTVLKFEIVVGTSTGPIVVHFGDEAIVAGFFDYERTAVIEPYAGSTSGLQDGPLELAQFRNPTDMAEDSQGNLYVTDSGNNMIRKISPDGHVSVYAGGLENGNADGTRLDARFHWPSRIAIDKQDNIYISDFYNASIRKIDTEGQVTTFVKKFTNGVGVRDSLNFPTGIALDEHGTLYVADSGNNRVLRISPFGQVTHLAGSSEGFVDGKGFLAKLSFPAGMSIADDGHLYTTELGNNSIRKIGLDGTVKTVAGNGTEGDSDGNALEASFAEPLDVIMDANGNLIVADSGNYGIRKIDANGQVSTLFKRSTMEEGAPKINDAIGLFIDGQGTLFVVEQDENNIKKITEE